MSRSEERDVRSKSLYEGYVSPTFLLITFLFTFLQFKLSVSEIFQL